MSPSAIQEEHQSNGHTNSAADHTKSVQKKKTYEKTKAALILERKYAAGNYHPLGKDRVSVSGHPPCIADNSWRCRLRSST